MYVKHLDYLINLSKILQEAIAKMHPSLKDMGLQNLVMKKVILYRSFLISTL